jgi:phage tail sheath protein FI
MARSIQSPGVELREIDLTIRPASLEGTSVFLAGFANQGPVDEVLQPTSISEWEQIYGTPTNSAEQYFYQTAKTLFSTSPAKVVATRLPYGSGRGEEFFSTKYSALVYPVVARKSTPSQNVAAVNGYLDVSIESENTNNWATLSALSGLSLCVTDATTGYNIHFKINDDAPLTNVTSGNYLTKVCQLSTALVNDPSDIVNALEEFISADNALSGFQYSGSFTPTSVTFRLVNVTAGQNYTTTQATRVSSTPGITDTFIATQGAAAISVPVGDANAVDTLSGGDVYFFGRPSHIELTQEQYTELSFENIDWNNRPTSSGSPINFSNIGDAGLVILNKAQTTVNNSFEGYYLGIIDNNNNNPATPYNGVGSINGVQSSSSVGVGRTEYLTVPSTRLNFPLSATKNGDGTSIGEILENLSNYELGNSDFDDTVSVGVFKLRKSIYTPDTVSLDFVLAESFVGSLDYHRQVADQTGGPANSFFLGEITNKSNNIKLLVNPWISNQYSNTWVGQNGKPTKKVRFCSDQLSTPFNVPGNVDSATSYVTRVGAASATVANITTTIGRTDALFPVGVYTNTIAAEKTIGLLPQKLERALDLIENSDIYPINIAVEAGLGTIFVNAVQLTNSSGEIVNGEVGPYIDSKPMPTLSAFYRTNAFLDNDSAEPSLGTIGQNIRSNYNAVANAFVNMAEKRRKDFMVILDPIRQIFVQGTNTKVISTKKLFSPNAGEAPNPQASGFSPTNFSQHIYWPLRHQFGAINSSYATTYANWAQVLDSQSNRQIWVPFSGFAAAAMANTDFNFNPWQAPAGFTRGILNGVNDLAVYPRQNQRDQLYKASLNPVTFFPGEGFVIFGQKTTLKKPSAFDRINVRRLFLHLEIITKNTMKYFVFEPNTLFTRTQVINTLTPVFDNARNNEGIYDYLIVCDERNNTPEVIDNNELKVDIYIKPVRTAEFILVTFYATRTSQNFQELVG